LPHRSNDAPLEDSGRNTPADVTIVQPILSGDPALAATLAANVTALPEAAFLWLVDEDDHEAARVTAELLKPHALRAVSVVSCEPAPQGINPKAWKLHRALPRVRTPVLVVLDDDTRLGADALHALLERLNAGASLATGLPRYHGLSTWCSEWLAEFVNSAAVLTYLPPLAFTQPLTIHGMCYAMRTAEVRELDLFARIERSVTDDLAIALELRRRGRSIAQTIAAHDIATSVPSARALWRILHRWFVFARLLLSVYRPETQAAIAVAFVIPSLLLLALTATAATSSTAAMAATVTLVIREIVLRVTKRRFLGAALPHRTVASVALELVLPILLLSAGLNRTISWRSRRIRIRSVEAFEYL
jgi:ceramide glucosyltransferase